MLAKLRPTLMSPLFFACGVRRTCTPKYKSLNTVIYPLWFTLHNLLLATEFISHLCNFSVV